MTKSRDLFTIDRPYVTLYDAILQKGSKQIWVSVSWLSIFLLGTGISKEIEVLNINYLMQPLTLLTIYNKIFNPVNLVFLSLSMQYIRLTIYYHIFVKQLMTDFCLSEIMTYSGMQAKQIVSSNTLKI
jgi:hypothetical protein